MTIRDFISALSGGYFDEKLHELYGDYDNEMLRNRIRYIDACEHFSKNYPKCDKIHVYSFPAKTTVSGVTFFLSADKIIIKGDGFNVNYTSDEIPKRFEKADFNDITSIPDCFSGYSLCVSDLRVRREYHKEIPQIESDDIFNDMEQLRKIYSEREIYRMAVCCDEKKRNQLQHNALMCCDIAEFFSLMNDSVMYTLCHTKARIAVLLSRDFLSGDGAVTAENNVVTAFVPSYLANDYADRINSVFGDKKCSIMQIRRTGGFEFTI